MKEENLTWMTRGCERYHWRDLTGARPFSRALFLSWRGPHFQSQGPKSGGGSSGD